MSERDIYDSLILGAGPTGLFAAFYAGLREMRTKIIEVLPEPGGQLAVLYPEKYIYDVAGFPKIQAKDLVQGLVEQTETWHPTWCYEEQARSLTREEDGILRIETDKGVHYGKTVIICAGIGAFRPNKLDNESLNRFEGNGVYYFVKSRKPFFKKKLLVVGGGDSALDWALNLKDYASAVTLIHRRDGFRAHPSTVTDVMNSSVNVKLFYEIREVHGDGEISGVTIVHNRTHEEEYIEVDAILMNLGFKADLGPIAEWGFEVDKRYILVNERQESSLPGVYAAGDISKHRDAESLNLIAVGFGHAAIAVNHAYAHITGGKVFPGHSSEMRL